MKKFHGCITSSCNAPVSNATVSIFRVYDTGTTYDDHVGVCSTDINGYYELGAEVYEKGSLKYYGMNITYGQGYFSTLSCVNYNESN